MPKIVREDCCDLAELPSGVLLAVVVLAIRLYRATPRPVRCRRAGASCSAYALKALREHGLVRGGGMALLYLADCAPAAGSRWADDPRCEWLGGARTAVR